MLCFSHFSLGLLLSSPKKKYEVARVADRRDPFARRIFLTSLCENRTRMHLQEFRLSRAYFFGTLIREGKMMMEVFESILAY